MPTICGENSGQHSRKILATFWNQKTKHIFYYCIVYIDIGANSGDTATLAFTFSTTVTNTNRLYDIKVTQLECDNPNKYRFWTFWIEKMHIKLMFRLCNTDLGTPAACSILPAAPVASRPSTTRTPTTTTSTANSRSQNEPIKLRAHYSGFFLISIGIQPASDR